MTGSIKNFSFSVNSIALKLFIASATFWKNVINALGFHYENDTRIHIFLKAKEERAGQNIQ
jgi:hypothetical protein